MPFELLQFEKKDKKTTYHITYMDHTKESVEADVINPSFPPLLIFADVENDEMVSMKKAVNVDQVLSIDVEYT